MGTVNAAAPAPSTTAADAAGPSESTAGTMLADAAPESDPVALARAQMEEMRRYQMDMLVIQHEAAKEKLFTETASALSKAAADTANKIGSKVGG